MSKVMYKKPKFELPEPISVKCFRCQTQFWISFILARKSYSKKNDWDYWTEEETDKDLKICNSCLREVYQEGRKKYLKSATKRSRLHNYIVIQKLV